MVSSKGTQGQQREHGELQDGILGDGHRLSCRARLRSCCPGRPAIGCRRFRAVLLRPARRPAATSGQSRARSVGPAMPYSRRPTRFAWARTLMKTSSGPNTANSATATDGDDLHFELRQFRSGDRRSGWRWFPPAERPGPAARGRRRYTHPRETPGHRSGLDGWARASARCETRCQRKRAQTNNRKYQRRRMNWNNGRLTQPNHQPASDGCNLPCAIFAVPTRHVHRGLRPPDNASRRPRTQRRSAPPPPRRNCAGAAPKRRRRRTSARDVIRNQAALHELPDHRAHALVDDELGHHEQRQRDQESHMCIHVVEERHRHAAAPRQALHDRQHQQRQPGEAAR